MRAWTLFSRLLYGFATAPHDLQNASEQAPSFAGTRLCRHQALQPLRLCGPLIRDLQLKMPCSRSKQSLIANASTSRHAAL